MTLPGLPASFRPGGPITPGPVSDGWMLSFLSAEADSTEVLTSIYRQARYDLESFIRAGDLTVSDATFYRNLLDEVDRVGSTLNREGATWTSSVIPDAYSTAWRTHSSVVVPTRAIESLSKDTLSLITQMNDEMRGRIRQVVGSGILEGLSGADLRQRLLQTGLKNIPHWPSVEYRAGVIARTETMRAYNGGATAGIRANGARFVEWIASPDEATCPICLPRDGQVYRFSGDVPGTGVDPFGPAVGPLPDIPAHPRCRCTVRARYRDQNGNVIPGTRPSPPAPPPKIPPKIEPGDMGFGKPPELPPSAGDWQKSLGRLAKSTRSDADRAFWRGLGRLDESQIQALAQMKGAAGNAATRNFLDLRYGIQFGKAGKIPAGYAGDVRAAMIRSLERLRAMNPDYVVDSQYLRYIGDRPFGASRFGSNTLGRAYATGHVEVKGLAEYAGKAGRSVRSGVEGADEVWTHEFMHTVHNRYGAQDILFHPRLGAGTNPYRAVEAVDREWHEGWETIRRSSQGVAPDEGALSRLRASAERYEAYTKDPERAWLAQYNADRAAAVRREIEELEQALAGEVTKEYYPTDYAQKNFREDFAESGMLYLVNPSKLRKFSPARYRFMRDRVFGGKEG